jgi:transposase
MKYTLEQKLEWILAYQEGRPIVYPSGNKETFIRHLNNWSRLYEVGGYDAIRPKRTHRAFSSKEKLEIVARVLAGETASDVARSLGMAKPCNIYLWVKAYREKGMDGLESKPKGRKPKSFVATSMNKKPKLTPSEKERLVLLQKENEYLRTENEYLKKLDALVMKREVARTKAKGRKSSKILKQREK